MNYSQNFSFLSYLVHMLCIVQNSLVIYKKREFLVI